MIKRDFNNGIIVEEHIHSDMQYHNHDFFELAYIKDGEGEHDFEDVPTKVKKGTYFIVDYKKFHRYRNVKTPNLKVINCMFKSRIIDQTLSECRSFSELIKYYQLKYNYKTLLFEPTKTIFTDDDGAILCLVEKIKNELNKESKGYTELTRLYLMEIIILTMRKIPLVEYQDSINEFIIKYIEKNYNNEITLTEIAKELNYSVAYLSRKFKYDNKISFCEYVQRTKIEESCRMLLNTNKKIIEIAELCGYNDVNYFNKIFKRYIDKTPREYRKLRQI